jgi:hypothetical protein
MAGKPRGHSIAVAVAVAHGRNVFLKLRQQLNYLEVLRRDLEEMLLFRTINHVS